MISFHTDMTSLSWKQETRMKIIAKYIGRQIGTVLAIVVAVGLLVGCAWYFFLREREPEVTAFRASASEAAAMARLCSIEIYNEATLTDTINSKMLFAVQKQKGRISFDVDSLEMRERGDTLVVRLPVERVELYEATDEDSWKVIDTKNVSPLGFILSDRLTLAEENALKRRFRRKSIAKLYSNGVVARARREAAENLQQMLTILYDRPVEVEQ